MSKRNQWRCIYSVFAIALFILGFFLPKILPGEIRGSLNITGEYSIFSDLSLAGYLLVIAMTIDFATKEQNEKFHCRTIVVLAISLCALAVILHPLTKLYLTESIPAEWRNLMQNYESYEKIFPAFLMSVAGVNVFLLGFNTKDVDDNGKKTDDNEKRTYVIRFLILGITLISLISIAVTFTLSSYMPDKGLLLSGSDRRAMIFGSNLFIPIATYALGYLVKLISWRIVKWIGVFLSLIIGFLMSMILYTLFKSNIFVCSASITIFLVEGFLLTLLE